MLLEGLAESHGAVAPEPGLVAFAAEGPLETLDLSRLVAALADEVDAARGAARFHATLVCALAEWAGRAASAQGLSTVACGGGCFLNAILARGLQRALADRGLVMLEARDVPPNDGGLALGQAWIARQAAR